MAVRRGNVCVCNVEVSRIDNARALVTERRLRWIGHILRMNISHHLEPMLFSEAFLSLLDLGVFSWFRAPHVGILTIVIIIVMDRLCL